MEGELEKARVLATRFISTGITLEHGIMSCVTLHDKDGSVIKDFFPSVYENALLMPLLKKENYNQKAINGLGDIILESRRTSSFWNMFRDVPDHLAGMFPDDLDNTCLCLYALLDNNMISLEECRRTVRKMFDDLSAEKRSPSGVWGTWLNPRENQVPHEEVMLILKEIAGKVRLCIGVVLNTLHLLIKLNMEHEVEGTKEAIDFVCGYLDRHVENLDVIQPEMYYYYNDYVIYFFIARCAITSADAGEAFGTKLAMVLQKRLENAVEQDGDAMNIALLILSTILMKLHKEGNSSWKIDKEEGNKNWQTVKALIQKLLSKQRENGSFPEGNFYRWSKNDLSCFGGGEILSSTFALVAINAFERELVSEDQKQ